MVDSDVVLDTSQQLGLNVTLETGRVTQKVVVSVGALELDTVSASTGGVVDLARVANMPAPDMNVWDDVVFAQGISSNSKNLFNLTPRSNGNQNTVSGDQTDENAFYLNGVPVSDQGLWHFAPSQNAVDQVQAFAMPYDAQYGRTGGGVFTTNLKTGTNAYHGAMYNYYGNKVLNANPTEANLAGIPRATNTRDTWGAESGGPIIKGKTFYFGSYEGFSQIEPGPVSDTVPTAAELNGNFSGTGYTIYDPLSTYCAQKNASGGCTTYARKAFANDVIPAARISPIGKAILALYPAQNKAGLVKNYVILAPFSYDYRQYMGRVDQNFSDNTRVYVLYARQTDTDYRSSNGFTNAASDSAVQNPTVDYNAIVDLTHIISTSTVLDLKASYWHDAGVTTNGTAVQNNFLASKLGFNMPAVGTALRQNIAPVMTITNATTLFGNTESGTMNADADFAGSVTQLIGRHSLHYGAEFQDIQTAPIGALGQPNGAFTFDSVYTQGNPLKAVTVQGNEFADVLLGYPSSGSVSWDEPTFITVHYYGAFVEDTYRVFPTLTVSVDRSRVLIDHIQMPGPSGDSVESSNQSGRGDSLTRKRAGGAAHFALTVPDVKAVVSAVNALEPGLQTVPPRYGLDNRWNFNLFGPDVTRMEFMQIADPAHPTPAVAVKTSNSGQATNELGIFEGQSDIGNPALAGSASFDPAQKQYTVSGAAPIYGAPKTNFILYGAVSLETFPSPRRFAFLSRNPQAIARPP